MHLSHIPRTLAAARALAVARGYATSDAPDPHVLTPTRLGSYPRPSRGSVPRTVQELVDSLPKQDFEAGTITYSRANYISSPLLRLVEGRREFIHFMLRRLQREAPPKFHTVDFVDEAQPHRRDISFGSHWGSVFAGVRLPPSTRRVRMQNVGLQADGLAKLLAAAPPLADLRLDGNPLGAPAMQVLDAEADVSRLESLSLTDVELNDQAVEPLARVFARAPRLRHIGLGGLFDQGIGAAAFLDLVRSLPEATEWLDLRDAPATGAEVTRILAARTPQLHSLHTSWEGPDMRDWEDMPRELHTLTARKSTMGSYSEIGEQFRKDNARLARRQPDLVVGPCEAVSFEAFVAWEADRDARRDRRWLEPRSLKL